MKDSSLQGSKSGVGAEGKQLQSGIRKEGTDMEESSDKWGRFCTKGRSVHQANGPQFTILSSLPHQALPPRGNCWKGELGS